MKEHINILIEKLFELLNIPDNTISSFSIDLIVYVIQIILTIILIILAIKILTFINHKITGKYLARINKQRSITIIDIVDNFIKYIVSIFGFFALLLALGVDPKLLLTSAGAASIIIGIAAQELIKDFINGLFIVIEGYYDVDDYIGVNNFEGTVVKLGIKATTLRTNQNEIVTIPNSLIEEIKNFSKEDIALFYEISTSYEADVDKITDFINESLLPSFQSDELVISASYSGVQTLNASSVDHMISIICRPENRYQVKRNLNSITKRLFEENNIEIPYQKMALIHEKEVK